MDLLREQSIEAFEVAVVRMTLVAVDVAGVEQRQRPLEVELERQEPSGMEHILKTKISLAVPQGYKFA